MRAFITKNEKEYAVKANTYMTACKYDNVQAYNLVPIKSICIDICPPDSRGNLHCTNV
jgi:hypothetical protein